MNHKEHTHIWTQIKPNTQRYRSYLSKSFSLYVFAFFNHEVFFVFFLLLAESVTPLTWFGNSKNLPSYMKITGRRMHNHLFWREKTKTRLKMSLLLLYFLFFLNTCTCILQVWIRCPASYAPQVWGFAVTSDSSNIKHRRLLSGLPLHMQRHTRRHKHTYQRLMWTGGEVCVWGAIVFYNVGSCSCCGDRHNVMN